ncbi:MAG: hypothetical protein WCK51_04965 [Armatimonadota bacterium]
MAVVVHFEPEFSVYRDKVRLPDLPTAKSRELLTFLVHHRGQRFERRILEERFWPGAERQRAQSSLRQAVFSIRQILGEDGPITANRRHVFCRASQVSVTQRTTIRPEGGVPEEYEAQLLASFRTLPLDQTVIKIQTELEQPGWSSEIRCRLRFLLAFAYHELGRSQLGLEMVRELVRDARTDGEMMIAKHALGGLLWHKGNFKEGIETLWEAASLAEDRPMEQVHILSNIAIGAYEAKSGEELRYSESLASQNLRLIAESAHQIVLDYVRGLALMSEYRYSEASLLFEATLIQSAATSHRISVYLLEANAHAKQKLGLDDEAKGLLDQAKAMRKAFKMHPSTVELRRLQKLRATLRES